MIWDDILLQVGYDIWYYMICRHDINVQLSRFWYLLIPFKSCILYYIHYIHYTLYFLYFLYLYFLKILSIVEDIHPICVARTTTRGAWGWVDLTIGNKVSVRPTAFRMVCKNYELITYIQCYRLIPCFFNCFFAWFWMHCTLLDSLNSLHDSVTTTVLVCISAIIDMYIYIQYLWLNRLASSFSGFERHHCLRQVRSTPAWHAFLSERHQSRPHKVVRAPQGWKFLGEANRSYHKMEEIFAQNMKNIDSLCWLLVAKGRSRQVKRPGKALKRT